VEDGAMRMSKGTDTRRLGGLALRFPDDLVEALRQMLRDFDRDFDAALGGRGNGFDPNDPRIVTVLLAVLAGFLAILLPGALLTGHS
jgi:hypothetical protein